LKVRSHPGGFNLGPNNIEIMFIYREYYDKKGNENPLIEPRGMEDGESEEKFRVSGLESRKERWFHMGNVICRDRSKTVQQYMGYSRLQLSR
jgi:hypothetical protein